MSETTIEWLEKSIQSTESYLRDRREKLDTAKETVKEINEQIAKLNATLLTYNNDLKKLGGLSVKEVKPNKGEEDIKGR